MKKIVPTIGRKVWFYPSASFVEDFDLVRISDQPFDATVVHVNGDDGGENPDFSVTLAVFDHEGNSATAHCVWLYMPDDAEAVASHRLAARSYATWMPYQAAQAK